MFALYRSLVIVALSVAFAPNRQPNVDWKPFTFTSAAGDSIAADSARVAVPENRARPTGRSIQIAVVRIRSTAAQPGSPIIYLAGGPGGPGIGGVRGDLYPTVLALREVSDVILFDQRGTGQTLPSLGTRRTLGVPLNVASTSPEAKQALLASSRAALEEVKARGIDVTGYNTNENADDIDDIRRALGVDKLVVWGHSYGSHLGLTYIRRHGEHVDRAILGGINGPDHRRRFPRDGDVLFARLDSVVRATPSLRAVMPDFLGTTKRVLDRLAQSPAAVTVDSQTILVGKEDVQSVIAIQSGEQAFVRRLPLLIGQMDAGNFVPMARLVRDVIKNRPFGTVMTYMMDLASGASEERMRVIRSQAPAALLGSAINFPFDDPDFQAVWASPDLGPAFRAPVHSPVPTLFISGTLDGRTSLGDAEEVRRGFSKNAHFILTGASHNPYALTVELRDAMVRFARGEMPRSATLTIPAVELRAPDEPEVTEELRKLFSTEGPEAAARRVRALAQPGSGHHITGVLLSDLLVGSVRQNPAAAAVVVDVALELFPRSSPLLTRRGEIYLNLGDRAAALAKFREAVQADPFNQVAAVQVKRLGAP